jgi:hypothetical protein
MGIEHLKMSLRAIRKAQRDGGVGVSSLTWIKWVEMLCRGGGFASSASLGRGT